MRSRHIRTVVFMAVVSVIGIMGMQVVWFKNAYDLKRRQFNHSVFLALQDVAEKLLEYDKAQVPLVGLVNQISNNYFAVNINGEIETSLLEFLLKTEFTKHNIALDFEYGVYSCESDKMVYGGYISFKGEHTKKNRSELPVWQKDKYYFCVLFPETTLYLTSHLGIWLFFNGVLLLICMFFGYALVIILKQKRLSEVQKDFINNMTHELKTPISTILVSTGIIKKSEILSKPGLIANYTNIIEHETLRLKGQVDKVLQIALLDKQKIDFNFVEVDMHSCIFEVAESTKLLLSEKSGFIHLDLAAENPLIVADEVHITNVIHNLLDNAVKYCAQSPEITIRTQNQKRFLTVSIIDNGIGISKENRKRVFDKFYRVSTGNIHNVKGFGLGLYYVKTVIQLHKGKLELDSEPGKGTEVRMFLPFIQRHGKK